MNGKLDTRIFLRYCQLVVAVGLLGFIPGLEQASILGLRFLIGALFYAVLAFIPLSVILFVATYMRR
ncbi:MAG: hypothetical protein JXR59_04050 [Desulfuromonadaceae bacterium]|nr:hypothetical protein [Desulfuromonadaceae bacterium]